MTLRYNLKALRESKGLTQDELATKSGISRATIWALETGQEKITTTKTLCKLAQALDVQVSDIFPSEEQEVEQ